jgi:serine/threonine protein kinase
MADKQGTCARAGTLDFAAPEVHRGQLSETSDQYSLAVTYYHLRTGEFPFPHPPAGFNRAYSYSRPSPDLSRIHYGERRVLERALDLEPHNRFPSCVAFAKAMNEVVSGPAFTAADTSTEMRVPDSVARAGARPS